MEIDMNDEGFPPIRSNEIDMKKQFTVSTTHCDESHRMGLLRLYVKM